MTYSWIDIRAVPPFVDKERMILFGAGQGTVEFLDWLDEQAEQPTILAIADNDLSMHGNTLRGLKIVSPMAISALGPARILVTTISGRETVPIQLANMGVSRSQICCIGTYPAHADQNLELLFAFHSKVSVLKPGTTLLHIGPGGFLGLECCLYALGMNPISMDAYSFGNEYPDVTRRIDEYEQSLSRLQTFIRPGEGTKDICNRFESIFIRKNGASYLDNDKIPYKYPSRCSAIPLDNESIDAVLSFAVLEHVRSPKQAVREIHRVLRPGGLALQRIVTRDHRSFGKIEGYHPFSYLEHSQEQWEELTKDKFHQNRVLPREWKSLFEAHGFEILHFQILEKSPLDPKTSKRILAMNPDLTETDLGAVNCDLIARKR